MIVAENLPLEGKIKIGVRLWDNTNENFILKRTNGAESIKLKELSVNVSGWSKRTITSSGYIYSIAYGNGLWVAVGSSGNLMTSVDGINWELQSSGFDTSYIYGVDYGSGLWVVGGDDGKLATSTDGINWELQSSGFGASYINDIAYGDGLWVAVGSSGKLATSTDGINWTIRASGLGVKTITKVAYGNGLWIIGDFSGNLETSTDGVNWFLQPNLFGSNSITSITYGNGLWIVGGQYGAVATSTNGINWDLQSEIFNNDSVTSIAYNNGLWVAGSSLGKIATSIDGVNWEAQSVNFGGSKTVSVVYGGGLWLAGSMSGKSATFLDNVRFIYDTIAQNNTTYIYSLEEKLSGATVGVSEVLSTFCDSFICDAKHIYKITDDLSYNNFERKKRGAISESYGRKYPIDHSFGISNYTSGSINFHINSTSSSNINSQNEIKYRKEILDFLSNKGAKIIKDLNGNIWLVSLYNPISLSFLKETGNQVCNISTEFVTIGEANTQYDLARAGMLGKFITE